MIEKGIAGTVRRAEMASRAAADAMPGYEDDYGKCRTCLARRGQKCVALNGRVAGGRPDGIVEQLLYPHARRPRLSRGR